MVEHSAVETGELQAHTEVAGGAGHEAEATAFGVSFLTPGAFVALAMLTVFAIMLRARVPALIAKALDAKISGIREQLDTAAQLRKEAEALKQEYLAKAKAADKDIALLKEFAERQAAEIVAKAKEDATDLIARHKAVSVAKIAAAERQAVTELRARAVDAASSAAKGLIASSHDAKADKALVDKAISAI